MTTAAPHNLEAEQGVLGSILLSDRALEPLLVEDGLRPGHFYRLSHEAVFEAMIALHDQEQPVDALTVTDQLRKTGRLDTIGGPSAVQALVGAADAPGNVRHYARIVVEQAAWRLRQSAASQMLQAVAERSEESFVVAEQMLSAPVRPDDTTSSPAQLAHLVFDYLEREDPPGIPTPFPRLTQFLNGGWRRGSATVLAGWTSMGKSVLVSDFLGHAARQGFRAHAYTNEMSREDFCLRVVAGLSGVPFAKLMAKTLDQAQSASVLSALEKIPFGVTDCAGWPADDIARHIRRNRWDLAAIDLIHRIPARDVSDWDHIAATLNVVALQADCHVLLVCQLNQGRNQSEIRPRPVLRDIRGTGMLANNAANVLFVHRDQEEVRDAGGQSTGIVETLPEGQVYLEKARNARLGGVRVRLDTARMRFEAVPA